MTPGQISMAVPDETAMVALGRKLSAAFEPGLVVFLQGGLGMGKTTLSRGIIQSLGHGGAVKSPTYTLVEPYQLGNLQVFHFDLYRLSDPEELEFMGIRDYFGDFSVCMVEWPERGLGALPPADLVITIARKGRGRCVAYVPETERGNRVLAGMPENPGAKNPRS
jgi:tRNA threonylcarbamoyladenosine biosynthesis protein TsaE